jgi:hypothetical protein
LPYFSKLWFGPSAGAIAKERPTKVQGSIQIRNRGPDLDARAGDALMNYRNFLNN